MKIVITGATGYIGTKLVKRLKAEGHQLYAIVRAQSNIKNIQNDVTEIISGMPYEKLHNKVKQIGPEAYINLAGFYCGTHTPDKIANLLDSNIFFPVYVLDAAVNAGCRYVIHTASVQQSYHGEYYNPINLYAATKQAFEDILYYYTSAKKISAVTLQLFDTYGADDTRGKVFNLVRRLKDGDRIAMSPGMQKLHFCYIDDVVEAYRCALKFLKDEDSGFERRYAVRGEQPIELRKFVELYLEMTQKNISIEWGGRPYMEREIMDSSDFGEILPNWKAKVSYIQGIELCSEYDKKKNTGSLI